MNIIVEYVIEEKKLFGILHFVMFFMHFILLISLPKVQAFCIQKSIEKKLTDISIYQREYFLCISIRHTNYFMY